MQKGILITLPKFDLATEYLTYYSKSLIEKAKSENLKLKEIHERELDMNTFSKIISNLDYKFIIFNGHGSQDSFFGYKNEILVKVGKNENLLKERIIYARSCDSGAVLGIKCTENSKQGCFIGYNRPFVFYMDENWTSNPNNDKVANLFLYPSNLIPLSIIKGNSTGQANENSKKQILKNIKRIWRDKSRQETFHIIEGLWNNYIGQVLHGNEKVCL